MLFQTIEFLIFFTLFFFLYWSISGKIALRNGLLLAVSFLLYSLWDFRFTSLLTAIILVNFISAKYIYRNSSGRRTVFYFALALNLLPLLFFKYFNFFIGSINDAGVIFGLNFDLVTLKLLLPVGISFYTFLSLSYLIDVYKNYIEAENNFINYALSISYFPITVAGPIHRPRIFLGQIKKEVKFDYELAAEGLRQILSGLFMKVVIADGIAKHVNNVFNNYTVMNGVTIILGLIYFSFQLYFDFGGYSEIAIGISKLLGFKINRNFRFPYLSQTIPDFWKRWHISLTEWFRDYFFLPLSYIISRKVRQGSIFDSDIFIYSAGVLATWVLTGLWHGAGWNFILWGLVHSSLLIFNKAFSKTKKKLLKKACLKRDNIILIVYESFLTFIFVNFAWIFFRSSTPGNSFGMLKRLSDISNWSKPEITVLPLIIILGVLVIEFFQKNKQFLFDISGLNRPVRWAVYIFITLLIIYYSGNESTFIYAGF
jgi:alginate O-acetyltransferase complex protein AlgI